jgi:hypothetical protein
MTRLVREADAQRDSRLLREFAASGLSVGCANTFLNPVGKHTYRLTTIQQPSLLDCDQIVAVLTPGTPPHWMNASSSDQW